MWPLEMSFSGEHGAARVMTGFNDLGGLFLP